MVDMEVTMGVIQIMEDIMEVIMEAMLLEVIKVEIMEALKVEDYCKEALDSLVFTNIIEDMAEVSQKTTWNLQKTRSKCSRIMEGMKMKKVK